MKLGSNTVLITGGAEGIGFGLAERFLEAGSEVIICGRSAEKLQQAQHRHPELKIRVCDVSRAEERAALLEWATTGFPNLNVLVNNAGIQQRFQLLQPPAWPEIQQEIAINLEAPVHLTTLFIPHLLQQERAAIVNITSGLAFAPAAFTPVYSATKAALHSFTLSLRHQLAATSVEVVEVIPPAVDTNLGGPGLHTFGVSRDEFVRAVAARIDQGALEIAYGSAEKSSQASRPELDAIFNNMNRPRT